MPPEGPDGSSQHDNDDDTEQHEPRPDSTGGLEALKRLLGRTGVFERYKLKGEIARGGMGAILRVWDEDLQRHLAMKVVLGQGEAALSGMTPPVDARRLARFLEEAQVTSQLDHPGIVPVHELGLDAKGCVYFTMKLVKGKTLKEVFDELAADQGGLKNYATAGEHVPWTQARVLGLIQRVCEATAYAHHKGVIHRDLKPANVMVGRFGEVYVMDWGLARVLDKPDPKDLRIRPALMTSMLRSERREVAAETPDSPLVTMDGDVVGTPSFMSPEQAAGRVNEMGPPSDVYAVGAMLYQMLAAEMPYVPRGAALNNYAIWRSVQAGPPTPLHQLAPNAPSELIAICDKAMARKLEHRYRDMAELAGDLAAYLEGRVVQAYETGAWAEARKWVARNKAVALTLVSILAAVSIAVVAAIETRGRREAEAQRRIAVENEAQASSERERAEASAEEARHQSYVANVRAAQRALELGEAANARRFLDAAPEDQRAWEWKYLDAEMDGSQLFLAGSAAFGCFSPDGSRVLTESTDGSARLWAAFSGAELLRLQGSSKRLWSGAFSNDGRRILTVGDGVARISDAESGAEIVALHLRNELTGDEPSAWSDVPLAHFSGDGTRVFTAMGNIAQLWNAETGIDLLTLRGHEGTIESIAISTDGRRLATGSRDQTARLWDAVSGACVAVLEGEGSGNSDSTKVALSSDGTRLAAAYPDLTARVFDADSGTELAVLPGHTGLFTLVGFSPDNRLVVTASWDNTARLWDASTGALVHSLRHEDSVFHAGFRSDGKHLVTASEDETARVWDVATGKELLVLRGNVGTVHLAAFSPDGARLLTVSSAQWTTKPSGMEGVRLWNARGGSVLRGHTGAVRSAEFSPDGTRVVTASDDGTARTWHVATGRELVVIRHDESVRVATFGPESGRILTGTLNGAARLWDSSSGEELVVLGDSQGIVSGVFSPDGSKVLAGVSPNDAACLWDASNGLVVQVFDPRTEPKTNAGHWVFVTFSPDGSQVATCSHHDESTRLWDAVSGLERLSWAGQRSMSPVFSPDGRRLLSSGRSGSMLWDTKDGRELAKLRGHQSNVWKGEFSPDGNRILTASGDGTARLWDADTGQELAVLRGHAGNVWSAEFSPDGTRVVTASSDRTARVWDAATGVELLDLRGHTDDVNTASFSPDGTCIVTASKDGTARLWHARPVAQRFREQGLAAAGAASEPGTIQSSTTR